MPNIETAISELLVNDNAIKALVDDRIRGGVAWQEDDEPYIVLGMPDDTEQYHLSGSSNLSNAKIEIDCWADTDPVATQVANAVRSKLNNYRGSVTVNGDTTHIRVITIDAKRRQLELEFEGSDKFLRGVGLTISAWYIV